MTALKEEYPLTLHLSETSPKDAFLVGEKAATLMRAALYLNNSVKIPDAFVMTTEFSDLVLENKEVKAYIKLALKQLDIAKPKSVKNVSHGIRKKIMSYALPDKIEEALILAFRSMEKRSKADFFSLAVKPSVYGYKKGALAESIHHTDLCVHSEKQFLRSVRLALASLFSESALVYREAQGIDHRVVKMALLVQEMTGSGKTVSGTVVTASQKNTMVVQASYGLPSYRSKQSIAADSYILFKPALQNGKSAIIKKTLGSKQSKIKQEARELKEVSVSTKDRHRFCLTDEQTAKIAQFSLDLEQHLGEPIFVEWARDEKNILYVLGVRMLVEQKDKKYIPESYELKQKSEVLLTAHSVGTKIVSGKIFWLHPKKSNSAVPEQAIVVAKSLEDAGNFITTKIKAIITESPIENNYILQKARELDIPVLSGARDVFLKLKNGLSVTLQCDPLGEGTVYRGLLPFEVKRGSVNKNTSTRTKLCTHIGDVRNAGLLASLPVDGIAVVEQNSIIKNHLRVHPLALVDSGRISHASTKRKITEITRGYESRADYAIHKLAEGIAEVAAAFFPAQVVLRMSQDIGEFQNLIGAQLFSKQTKHEWQGASRYYSKFYKQAFALECKAIKKAREDWGLSNIEILIPYCRTPEEGKKVLEFMETCGLKRGEHGLKVQISCDIPSNLILAEEYAKLFDGLSLGAYADTNSVSSEQDNPIVRQMLKEVISLAHKHERVVSFLNQHGRPESNIVEFLVRQGVDSISVDTDAIVPTREQISYIEQTLGKTGHRTGGKFLSLVVGCAVLAAGLINLGAGCVFTGASPSERTNVIEEITPAEIRAQIIKEVGAKKDAERSAGRSKLKISGFVPLELMYPSGWNVEYWNDGVTLVSPTDPNEYVSIFRQLISHPISYNSSLVSGVSAQKASIPLAGTEKKMDILEFPIGIKNYVIEINGHSDIADQIINSIKLTDTINTKINPLLNHWDVREKRVCTNMAVFARADKKSGECSLYKNPCDVPDGWYICDGVDK